MSTDLSVNKRLIREKSVSLIVDEGAVLQRIDNFLFRKLKKVPKSRIYSMLRKGEVRVNSKRVAAPYKLELGDQVRIPPYWGETAVAKKGKPSYESIQLLKSRILVNDEGLIAINKPSGIAAHGGSGISFGVIEILRAAFPKLKDLELVHRLDRDTSGCMLIAKKRSMLRTLHELIRNAKISKHYLVLVRGRWEGKKCYVEAPLSKNQLSSGERVVKVSENGKFAKSLFTPKKIFANASLMEVEIFTGRTHQIRAHATHLGFPVAGDEKYGDKEFNRYMKGLGLNRLFLHAESIHCNFPDGKVLNVHCQLDLELEEVLSRLAT